VALFVDVVLEVVLCEVIEVVDLVVDVVIRVEVVVVCSIMGAGARGSSVRRARGRGRRGGPSGGRGTAPRRCGT
jgi:hypothetical protein